jgi:hypothetical protein
MFRFASDALYDGDSQRTSAHVDASCTSCDTAGPFGRAVVCVARDGDALGCGGLTVVVLPPKPKKTHQSTTIAASPRTAAEMSFFFSPGLFKSTSSILIILDH